MPTSPHPPDLGKPTGHHQLVHRVLLHNRSAVVLLRTYSGSSRCFKTLSPSPHARPARPIGPAKPLHVPRSTSHDLPARSDSIAPGPTSASLTPNATSLRAPSLPRSPACPSAAGARTTGERTRKSGVGDGALLAARGGGLFTTRAAAWRDVTAAQKVPTGRSVPGNPCVCCVSAVTCHSLSFY